MPRSGAAHVRDHAVLFYDHAQYAVDRLADYVAEGLLRGEAVATVLVPAHADALVEALRERDIDADRASAEGRLLILDVAETLQTFLVDGAPDRDRLTHGVGAMIADLGKNGRPVRAAGEMAAVLWAGGNITAALALETAWNALADSLGISLLCPHPASAVESSDLDVVGRLCALHTDVLAPEGYASSDPEDAPPGITTGVFVPAPEAVGATRRLVAEAMGDWSGRGGEDLDDLLVADACLVASEMAANAVTHAQTAFEVRVTCSPGTVRVAVADVGPGYAEERHARLLDPSGRGLAIVADVADRWGCDLVPGGKVVWAELEARQPVAL